jgi:hypothetical protein
MFLKIDYDNEEEVADFSLSTDTSLYKSNFSSIASCASDEWSNYYSSRNNLIPLNCLPPAVRYISSDRRLIVWERPPAYKSINYTQEYQDALSPDQQSTVFHRLPVPWQVYVIHLSPEARLANVFMFFRNSQINSMVDDQLCFATLPNFYETGRLCQAAFDTIQSYDRDVLSSINAAYEMIWNSGFNKDTLLAYNSLFNTPGLKKNNPLVSSFSTTRTPYYTFDKWTKYRIEDVVTWTWPTAYNSLHHFIETRAYAQAIEPDSHNFMVNMLFAAQDAPQKTKQ